MPSRVSRVLEPPLRAIAIAALAWTFWLVIRAPGRRASNSSSVSATSLRDWTRGATDEVDLAIEQAPDGVQRAWLAALSRAGTQVRWRGSLPALAIEPLRRPDPSGGGSVLVAAPAGSHARLSDTIGVFDSAMIAGAGASFTMPFAMEPSRVSAAGGTASSDAGDSVLVRAVAVLGNADWESRFVVAALEERGWHVEARLAVAPGIAVREGNVLPLDTSRLAAVVVLDTLAPADAAQLAHFVAAGGGVVAGPRGAASLGTASAGTLRVRQAPATVSFASAAPRRALPLWPIAPRRDALVLESQGRLPTVVARRIGAGRVIVTGYEDTWRWRMAGGPDAVDAHREWWSGLVAAVAYAPTAPNRVARIGNRAPLASFVAAVGPASTGVAGAAPRFDPRSTLPLAGTVLFLSLLGEWISRRLRGAA